MRLKTSTISAKYVIRNIVECLKNIGNFINLSTIFFIPIDKLSVRK